MKNKEFLNCNIEKISQIAGDLAKTLRPEDIVCLRGDLGVGKTTFSKILINTLLKEKQEITSPTFNLVHTYDSDIGRIWHFDLYRLKNKNEIYELGIEDAFSNGISIIEWPEIIDDLLQEKVININFSFAKDENYRDLVVSGK